MTATPPEGRQMTHALKFTRHGAIAPVFEFPWPKPRGTRPGKWVAAEGKLEVCANGVHAVKLDEGALDWIDNPECWVIELGGEVIYDEEEHKYVARKGRLVRRVDSWNEQTQRLFAGDCAAHVLPIFERKHPDDDRPRKAIAVARRYARGKATDEELGAAWEAAWDAAWAVGDAAWAVADPAWAPRIAAWAARDVAWAPADVAWASRTTKDAAWAAGDAWAPERRYQTRRLLRYIDAPELS